MSPSSTDTIDATRHARRRRVIDALLLAALRCAAGVSAAVVLVIAWFVAAEAWPGLRDVGVTRLLTDDAWRPTAGRYGMAPMLIGTLAATFGAVLLTAPLGVGSAVFLRFYAPRRVASVYRRVVELLAGVPSVVFGLWGIAVLAPLIATVSPLGQGQSLLAGVLILTMMTLPTVALTTDAAIAAVPADTRRGAAALGLSRRAIAWRVVIPAARAGIVTGVILQTGRALGETMAVLMVCGNIVQTPHSVFDPVRTLTANIALEMGYADDRHRAVLFVSGLVLMLLVAGLVLIAEAIDRRRVHVT